MPTQLTVRRRPALDTMPLEILTMIMCLMMGPEDATSVWFDFRRVCRTFKEAVEIAIRIHILPSISMQFNTSNWERVQVVGPIIKKWIRAGTLSLPFSGLAIDETRATFTLNKLDNKGLSSVSLVNLKRSPLAVIISFRVQEGTGKFKDIAIEKLKRGLECYASTHSLPGPLRAPSPFVASTCAFPPPRVEDVGLDLERMQITLPWKPIISSLFEEQALIAKHLKASALKDIERDPWANGTTLSRKDEALKLALSSRCCRQIRFTLSLAYAVEKRNEERQFQSQRHDDKGSHGFGANTIIFDPETYMLYHQGWKDMTVDFENLWYQE
ncbi:hypothetical protein SLS62_009223 [Diatrype stigma]|uniref:F-box domain-containing protein n=1 Tax=Diatrype stigma TaxID=117547 RepID=A0AAN9UG42_9PEZI